MGTLEVEAAYDRAVIKSYEMHSEDAALEALKLRMPSG